MRIKNKNAGSVGILMRKLSLNAMAFFARQYKALLLVLIGAGIAGFVFRSLGATGLDARVTVPVEKGPFAVKVLASGKLEAATSFCISSPIEWQMITWLVPEGSIIKKGDIIVRFDKTNIEEQLREATGGLRIAKCTLEQAERTLEFEKQKSSSQVENSKAALEIAKAELADLRKRPRPDDLKRAEVELRIAQAVWEAAKADYENMKQSIENDKEKAVFSLSQLRKSEQEYKNALADLETAEAKHDSVKAGPTQATIKEAELKMAQAELDLQQAESELPEKIAQMQADIQKAKADVDKSQTQVERQAQQLADADFKSPAAGMVAYRTFRNKKIAKGMNTWKGAAIMDLPDVSKMLLKARVRESLIGQILQGQKATITVDAVPGQVFPGTVVEVGKVAKDSSETEIMGFDQQQQETGIKVFDITISVDAKNQLLKPNMIAKSEIEVWKGQDVLSVATDAVYDKGGKKVAYVADGYSIKERELELGHRADNRVEVKKGLEAGERVCLKREEE